MKDLIQLILDHPERFEPTDFAHCGLQSLVRIAQEAHAPAQSWVEGSKLQRLVMA